MPSIRRQRIWGVALVALGLSFLETQQVQAAAYQDLLVSNLSSNGTGNVQAYNPVTGVLDATISSGLSFPRGIAVAANTNILVGDIGTNSIHT